MVIIVSSSSTLHWAIEVKKSVCNGLLFTGNIHPSSMTLGGPVVLLVCGFKRHYLHNQSEYRKSPTHFCWLMLCELGCRAILHVLHTYTYIYFIYARNSQCSCRANIFEEISYNKIKICFITMPILYINCIQHYACRGNITCRSTVVKLHIWGSPAWIQENLMFCKCLGESSKFY